MMHSLTHPPQEHGQNVHINPRADVIIINFGTPGEPLVPQSTNAPLQLHSAENTARNEQFIAPPLVRLFVVMPVFHTKQK